jgi:hypothetical protein
LNNNSSKGLLSRQNSSIQSSSEDIPFTDPQKLGFVTGPHSGAGSSDRKNPLFNHATLGSAGCERLRENMAKETTSRFALVSSKDLSSYQSQQHNAKWNTECT